MNDFEIQDNCIYTPLYDLLKDANKNGALPADSGKPIVGLHGRYKLGYVKPTNDEQPYPIVSNAQSTVISIVPDSASSLPAELGIGAAWEVDFSLQVIVDTTSCLMPSAFEAGHKYAANLAQLCRHYNWQDVSLTSVEFRQQEYNTQGKTRLMSVVVLSFSYQV